MRRVVPLCERYWIILLCLRYMNDFVSPFLYGGYSVSNLFEFNYISEIVQIVCSFVGLDPQVGLVKPKIDLEIPYGEYCIPDSLKFKGP